MATLSVSPTSSRRTSKIESQFSSTTNLVETETTSDKSLNIITATIFIVGSICGGGVLAIPKAIVDCGVVGAFVLVSCGLISSFTGYILGKCWTVLRIRYPEYEDQRMTDPYPTIAFRAGGKVAKVATRICIDVTLFGGGTVFLLLIAGNISQLIYDLSDQQKEFSLCFLLLIITAVLIPVSWLGTPKDFWQIAAVAASTSILAAIFILASLITTISKHPDPSHSDPTAPGFFSAFGTILFAFGGASCFPTIQVDMKEPQKFPISVVLGICTVMAVYLLVGIPGYVILGNDITANVISAIPPGWMSYTVNFLITFHLMMAFIIVLNPVAQEIEGTFRVPDSKAMFCNQRIYPTALFSFLTEFCLKRVVVRTVLHLSSMFVGLTIPHFNIILSLLGGSTIACTNFIFPPLYYYLLSRQTDPSKAYGPTPSYMRGDESPLEMAGTRFVHEVYATHEWMEVQIPLHIKTLLFAIMAIGIVGGVSSTYFSFATLVDGSSGFTVPCYVNASVGLPTTA